jgi:glycosyltransferase involved in cell wall biosynthesis
MDTSIDKGLVSIIMLSHGDSTYVVETVKSILSQTYQNSCVPDDG